MLRVFLLCWFVVSVYGNLSVAKCSYGERGSLTATCVNAYPEYFKSTFYKFDHLDETVVCVNCNLTTIESNTFDLAGNQIKFLQLSNSRIVTLKPKAFMGLIFLEQLDLSKNHIQSILPGTFTGTKKINTLDISNNDITTLTGEGFKELGELVELRLAKNSIKTIESLAFKGLNKLQILDLSYNYISVVNDSMRNLTSMELLNLKHNDLRQLLNGDEFFNMAKLSKLDLSENQLDNRFSLNMTGDNQLRELLLRHNNIGKLWFNISHLDFLEHVDLGYNNISVVNVTSNTRLVSLQSLELDHNKITVFNTRQFTGLPQLRYLNFSYNVIQNVVISGVFSIPNLHTLDLSHNRLTDLDYVTLISRLPSLSYIRLEGNILPCGLEKEMTDSFEEDNFKFVIDEDPDFKICVDKPSAAGLDKIVKQVDKYVAQPSDRLSASDIIMFILIALVIAAISLLFYVQYLFYKGVEISLPRRGGSNLNLINPEPDQREEEFMNALA